MWASRKKRKKALGAEPGGERWIETLPRRGYRFIGPITTPVHNAHRIIRTARFNP